MCGTSSQNHCKSCEIVSSGIPLVFRNLIVTIFNMSSFFRSYTARFNNVKYFTADLSDVLSRSFEGNVDKMIITGGSLTDCREAIELSKRDGKFCLETIINVI